LVPELSPRETKFALPASPAAAIRLNACAALCGAPDKTPAGSSLGPMIT
jgi:hypothetical protein